MKLKILIPFQDKNTGANYKAGDEVEFDTARGKELLADKRNLVAAVEEPKKATRKKAEE